MDIRDNDSKMKYTGAIIMEIIDLLVVGCVSMDCSCWLIDYTWGISTLKDTMDHGYLFDQYITPWNRRPSETGLDYIPITIVLLISWVTQLSIHPTNLTTIGRVFSS